jgi:hypothetical protein
VLIFRPSFFTSAAGLPLARQIQALTPRSCLMSVKKMSPEKRISPPGKKPLSAKAKADAMAAERQEWGSLRLTTRAEQAVAYNMNGSYRAKTLLRHALFGLGMVTRVAGPHKIEVLFEDGKKLLRCQ